MNNRRPFKSTLFAVIILAINFCWITAAWGHGDEIMIIPETLSVRSGAQLKVEVNGLVNTKTATFSLTGLEGKYDLGKFSISSDDFDQVLQIPPNLSAGSYRLTVEGGGNSAKVVITIN